ncbi:MAG: N-acetylmuramoyl-L-alanine amidase [Leptolyngbya sp. UWPOB_LEPTO1]|uniref:N-acetylmuramoyl-L-alanine amidase n=1 Tax=Leptolyngbya sp. UWPOB_LEPTO1 TaxID=2815653 RepID=UPI001AC74E04|nr:N-acetylmuramoyl-L-alanine amidase [Leptolyngbya sp. UWPOB_LEPTO1]MBN8560872.1 N-acetylmuramoyl-L-alanine amidase [Leptolyngbya sp. UWPOB_LEPTO1]
MKRFLSALVLAILTVILTISIAWSKPALTVVYPPGEHETIAKQIFLIGSAPPQGEVLVNGKRIQRSRGGHFAPSFPLQMGENQFSVRYGEEELQIKVTRKSNQPPAPVGQSFAEGSLTPTVDVARLPGEAICLSAIAPPNSIVNVKVADQMLPLIAQSAIATLPANSGVLTGLTEPTPTQSTQYAGCVTPKTSGDLGKVTYLLGNVSQEAPGKISILDPARLEIAEVTAEQGTARTGASTDFSRLTPLPRGTRATITAREGDWLRLEYGGWIRSSDVKIIPGATPVRSLIRGITSRTVKDWTEVRFPLQIPVPITVAQDQNRFILTLYNTTAQTDTIRLSTDPAIARLDWQQVAPEKIEYRFNLKSNQQWGYKLRYEGTTLVLSLKHPPRMRKNSLSGMKILLDPGHGGSEDLGSRGGTGYPEKEVALITSKLLREELVKRGARVVMTREADIDLDLAPRVKQINETEPTIALSIHYNALPDDGDAINTKGVATFWYQPQAHDLAVFLHDYLVKKLDRPSYGVYWNNLALTRPTVAPTVLLELGFMINPDEFEWITNPVEQKRLAATLADGVTEWFAQSQLQ